MGIVVFSIFCNMSFGDCFHPKYSKKLPQFHRGGGGGRPQLCGLSYLLLFRVGTVSDPLVGTWCFGFPTYHKAIFEIISRKIDKSFRGVVTILKFVFEGVLL